MRLASGLLLALPLALLACRAGEREAPAPAPAGPAAASDSPGPAGPPASDTVASAVGAAFDAYKAALAAGDGEAAADLVDRRTLGYYDRALRLAQTAPADSVRALPLYDQTVVLTVRHRLSGDRIAALGSGRDLIAHGVENGWIGRAGMAQTTLGAVRAAGDSAWAPGVVGGRPAPFTLTFRREGAAWKLDLTASSAAAGRALEAGLQHSGLARDVFLTRALGASTGQPVDASIWEPPVRP